MDFEQTEDGPSRDWTTPRLLVLAGALAVAVTLAAALVATGGPWDGEPDLVASTEREETTTTEAPTTTSSSSSSTTTTAPPLPPTTAAPTTSAAPVPPPPPTTVVPAPAAAAPPDVAGTGALCVGDSIMLGASSQYYGTLTMCGTVDAKVGRQMSAGASTVAAHAPYPSTVIVGLGTNGYTNAGEIDAVLSLLSGVPRVVVVTVQLNGTRAWESSVNGELWAAAGRWANVRIADWYGASSGHPGYFSGDSIHLSSSGAQAYAGVVATAL